MTMTSEMKMTKTKCLNPPRTAKKVETNIKDCQEEVKNKIIIEAFELIREEFDTGHEIEEEHFEDFHKDHIHHHDHHDYHHDHQGHHNYHYDHQDHQDHQDHHDHNSHEEKVEFDSSPENNYHHQKYRYYHDSHDFHHYDHHNIKKRSFSYHPTLVANEDKRLAGCLLHCVYAKNNAIDKLGWPTLDGLVNFYSEGVNEHGFFMATLRSVNLCLKAATYKYHVNRNKLPEKGESCDLAFEVFDCISDQITAYCLDHYNHE